MVPLTRHGWREMLIGTLVLALLAFGLGWAWWPLAILTLPIFIWLFAFFRDPERAIPADQHVMVSPADGVVSDITDVEDDPRLGGPAVRVGIFLSVFNVHVNRAPCDGKILKIEYRKGKFINAMRHNDASSQNESNTVVMGDSTTGEPIAVVRQIVGLIARRIVFPHAEGEIVTRGQRIGMIKFGSRTELYIPLRLKPKVLVQVGQKVNGAKDVIAKLEAGVHAATSSAKVADEYEPVIGRNTPA